MKREVRDKVRPSVSASELVGELVPALERWAFGFLLTLHLVPLWAFAYVPTQDGPAHLENAAILLRHGAADVISGFYDPNLRLVPNWLWHGVLVGLLTLFRPLTAEKLALSAYALALPLAFRCALPKAARSRGFAIAIFPFLFGYAFYMGFASFCLSLAFYFVALASWRELRARPSLRRGIGVALASFFTAVGHAVTFVALLVTLAALSLGRASTSLARIRGPRRKTRLVSHAARALATAVALAPGALLVLAFARQGVEGHELAWLPLERRLYGLGVLLSVVAMSPQDLYVSSVVAVAIGVGVIASTWSRRRMRATQIEWLWAAGALLLLALLAPDRIGRGWGVTLRLQIFPFAAALFAIGVSSPTARAVRVLPLLCGLASVVLLTTHLPGQARLSAAIEEYVSVASQVEAESVVLPLQMTLGRDLERDVLFPLNYAPLLHTNGYVAALRDVVDLANYEAATTLFPVRYRPDKNPYRILARGNGLEGEGSFPCVALESADGHFQIDYVVVWGPIEPALGDGCVREWTRHLAATYDLAYLSQPRGMAQLWRRRRNR